MSTAHTYGDIGADGSRSRGDVEDVLAMRALKRATRHPDEVRKLVAEAVRDGEARPRAPGQGSPWQTTGGALQMRGM
jgi:hypothetical protein